LGMRHPPNRIECFDNSNLAGTDPVSAMVVFEQGEPSPSGYRLYRLQTGVAGDDYAYMFEVLHRRLGKGPESAPLPDLLLVDGGKGQLNVALGVLEALGLRDRFSVVGIAKKNEALGEKTDKIFLPGRANPLQFGKDADLLLFLQRVRDEAHRSAVGYQRRTRGRQSLASSLDGLTGIGPKRKAALLRHFGSMDRIREATVEELSRVPGISTAVARTIQEAFSNDGPRATADRQ